MAQDPFGLEPQGPDTKRLLLAVALMTGVLMLFGVLFPTKPQVADKPDIPKKAEQIAKVAPAPNLNAVQPVAQATSPQAPIEERTFEADVKNASSDEKSAVVRGGYVAKVSSLGAKMTSFHLTGYESPVELAMSSEHGRFGLFTVVSRDAGLTLTPESRYVVKESDDKHIVFEHMTPEGVVVRHAYRFRPDAFIVEHEITLNNSTAEAKTVALDVVATGEDHNVESSMGFFGAGKDELTLACQAGATRETLTVEKLKDDGGKKLFAGEIGYIALDQRYFLVGFAPLQKALTQGCLLTTSQDKIAAISLQQKPIQLSAGATANLQFESYLGPKQLGLLKAAGHNFEDNINFGIFSVISRPLLWLLVQLYQFLHNFGLAIILLTFFIKLITFPLTQKSFMSMQEMKKIGPEIKELKKKFGHDQMLFGQKQMELYKQHGINPMAGCLPMLIQMPIWLALYQMLWNSVELYQQPFYLWITDLTKPDPYYVIPILMGATQLVQSIMQPPPEDQPQMKYVMWFMPIFMTMIMINLAVGLSIYIFTNNILTILQQLYVKKRYAVKV